MGTGWESVLSCQLEVTHHDQKLTGIYLSQYIERWSQLSLTAAATTTSPKKRELKVTDF